MGQTFIGASEVIVYVYDENKLYGKAWEKTIEDGDLAKAAI
jgi:hypothetical protein